METKCSKLDKAQIIALCAILPVWKITIVTIIKKEAATFFIYHILDSLCELATLYLHKLEPFNPLQIGTK